MVRWPSWVLVPMSIVLSAGIFVAALTFGLRIPDRSLVGALPGDLGPDYGTSSYRGFSKLSAAYIARILGHRSSGSPQGSSRSDPSGPGAARGPRARVTITHEATNDGWAQAFQISSVPFTAKTNTSSVGREPGEPADCAPAGGSVWYRFKPAEDLALIANTFGSSYSTALNVLTGEQLGSMTSIGCDRDAEGASIVAFRAKANTTYYFQVVGPIGGGNLVFTLEPPGSTSRVSISSNGGEGDAGSGPVLSVSADGRYVTFASIAGNLAAGGETRCASAEGQLNWGKETGGRCPGVFLHDRVSGKTSLVSVSSSGEKGNDASFNSSISADGRYVAFESLASNLAQDSNGVWDIFVRDLIAGTTERVSISTSGREAFDPTGFVRVPYLASGSGNPSISADGRFVAFNSWADNLVDGDTPGQDIFVRDRLSQTTEIISVSSGGANGEGIGDAPSISSDGRYVAFQSRDSTLVPGDDNEWGDVFVHDRLRHTTVRASVSSAGLESDGESWNSLNEGPGISGSGRYVSFYSWATNLVEGDNNNTIDVFVHDLLTGITVRASISSSGQEISRVPDPVGSGYAVARMSHDGRYVSFVSNATDLVPGKRDTTVDVFVHDLLTRTTIRVSESPTGEGGNADSSLASLSPDGRSVAYFSAASNLVPGDGNQRSDVFVFDRPE